MADNRFFICRHCGNLIGMIFESGVPMMCCGEDMEQLEPNTSDGAGEKHVPVVSIEDGVVHVSVGEVPHPMLPEHYIQWVYLQTERGGQRKALNPGEEPKVSFWIGDDKPVAVYEYCNLHGLWKTDL